MSAGAEGGLPSEDAGDERAQRRRFPSLNPATCFGAAPDGGVAELGANRGFGGAPLSLRCGGAGAAGLELKTKAAPCDHWCG
jgi:hypothetical protein